VKKIVEVAEKARKKLVLRLEYAPVSVPVKTLLTSPARASLSVSSLTPHSKCLPTARTVKESTAMVVSPLPAVAVVVNPVTRTSEPIVVVNPDVPSRMIKNSSCEHESYYSLALVIQRLSLSYHCLEYASYKKQSKITHQLSRSMTVLQPPRRHW
jgi:hypothetical protein